MKRLACLLLLCMAAFVLSAQGEGALELISDEELPSAHRQAVSAAMSRLLSDQMLWSQERGAPSGYSDTRSDGSLSVTFSVSASRVVAGQKVTFKVDLACEDTPMYITYSCLTMDASFTETEETATKNYRSYYKTASASWSHTPDSPGHFCFVLVVSDAAGNIVSFHTNTVQVVEITSDDEYTSKAVDGGMTAIVTLDKRTLKVGETLTAQVSFLYDVDPIRYTGSWLLYDEADNETLLSTFQDTYLTGGDTIMTYSWTAEKSGELVFRLEAEDGEDNRVLLCTPGVPVESDRLPGDANDDGSVNIYDALRVLQYGVDSSVAINLSNADVNADGQVDIHDALLLLQYDAGWRVTLV